MLDRETRRREFVNNQLGSRYNSTTWRWYVDLWPISYLNIIEIYIYVLVYQSAESLWSAVLKLTFFIRKCCRQDSFLVASTRATLNSVDTYSRAETTSNSIFFCWKYGNLTNLTYFNSQHTNFNSFQSKTHTFLEFSERILINSLTFP